MMGRWSAMMECVAGLVCDNHIAVATRGMEVRREVVEFRSFQFNLHLRPCVSLLFVALR